MIRFKLIFLIFVTSKLSFASDRGPREKITKTRPLTFISIGNEIIKSQESDKPQLRELLESLIYKKKDKTEYKPSKRVPRKAIHEKIQESNISED